MNNQFSMQQQPTAAMTINSGSSNQGGNFNDIQPINISFSRNSSVYNNPRLRRESIAHSQGMGGVSWGSVGIGSWLKDEVFMHQSHSNSNNNNNNNNNNNSSSANYFNQLRNQSININNGNFNNNNVMDLRGDSIMMSNSPIPNSAYLADLEANYCKDYSCCGQLLPTLHDLLKHYEEMHIANDGSEAYQSNLNNFQSNASNINNDVSNARIRSNNNPIGAVSTNEVFLNNHLNTKQNMNNNNKKFNMNPNSNKQKQASNLSFSMNSVDINNQHSNVNGGSSNNINNSNSGNNNMMNLQQNELHKTLSNFNFDQSNIQSQEMQFDFSNNSGSNIFQNDALVKDLENQTKMFHQQIQQQQSNHQIQQEQHMQHQLQQQTAYQQNLNKNQHFNQHYSNNTNMNTQNKVVKNRNLVNSNMDMDIDHDTQFQMDVDDDANHDDEVPEVCIDDPARRLYVMEQRDERPFSCPVIGCDKTYKNQNGLKYHRIHGHQNQTLRENSDGTFSVINPDSDSPYPHGMGFEKDKPYRCEVCGKRYKNLNGLKYHRGHTTH